MWLHGVVAQRRGRLRRPLQMAAPPRRRHGQRPVEASGAAGGLAKAAAQRASRPRRAANQAAASKGYGGKVRASRARAAFSIKDAI